MGGHCQSKNNEMKLFLSIEMCAYFNPIIKSYACNLLACTWGWESTTVIDIALFTARKWRLHRRSEKICWLICWRSTLIGIVTRMLLLSPRKIGWDFKKSCGIKISQTVCEIFFDPILFSGEITATSSNRNWRKYKFWLKLSARFEILFWFV